MKTLQDAADQAARDGEPLDMDLWGGQMTARGRLDDTTSRAFPLAPPYPFSQIDAIIHHLAVEVSRRYQPAGGKTYCNIYAHDFARLSGLLVPRTWWRDPKSVGEGARPIYRETVVELNANSLHDWMVRWGKAFGWTISRWREGRSGFSRQALTASLQDQVSAGQGHIIGCIAGRRSDRSRPGHIAMVLPLRYGLTLLDGEAYQSQAGAKNFMRAASAWHMSSKFDSLVFAHGKIK